MISPVTLSHPRVPIILEAFATLPVLRTDRLILRAPKVEDFALYVSLMSSDRAQYLGGPSDVETAWADFTNYTAGWLLRGDGMFSVADQGTLVGFVFAGIEPGDDAIELGWLFSSTVEGHGVAFEASCAVLNHLTSLGIETVASYIDPRNARAEALAKRLGALRIGEWDGSEVWNYDLDGPVAGALGA